MVSVTRAGVTLCRVTSWGSRRATSAGDEPAPRPLASTVAANWSTASAASVGAGPATTMATVDGSVVASRPAARFCTWTAIVNGRVPASGTTVTVTVASTGSSMLTPSGRRSGTRAMRVCVRPLTSTAAVSTRSIAASTLCSPRTVTATGSVMTREIQYPVATLPRRFQSTGSVRVVAVGSSGTLMTTTPGSTCKPSIGSPFASTGTGGALCVRSVVTSPNRTVANTAATSATLDSGPVIFTSVGEIEPVADALRSAQGDGDIAQVSSQDVAVRDGGLLDRHATIERHDDVPRRRVLHGREPEEDRDEQRRQLERQVVRHDAPQIESPRPGQPLCASPHGLGRLRAERQRLDATPQERQQHATEPLLVEAADHPPVRRDRDPLRLLRDDDHHRVGLRADRERRAVPHAVAVRAILRVLERQQARRRDDRLAAHDHRAVVQR